MTIETGKNTLGDRFILVKIGRLEITITDDEGEAIFVFNGERCDFKRVHDVLSWRRGGSATSSKNRAYGLPAKLKPKLEPSQRRKRSSKRTSSTSSAG